jgi:hypothetical protein
MSRNPIRVTLALPLEIDLGDLDWEPISDGTMAPVCADTGLVDSRAHPRPSSAYNAKCRVHFPENQ